MKYAWLCAFAIGCGGGSSGGEPQLGDATLQWGPTPKMMETGAAIKDPKNAGQMRITLGNDHVGCSTDYDMNFPPPGDYVYFSVAPQTGPTPSVSVTIIHYAGKTLNLDITSGDATISAVSDRVMGNVTFMTTDDMAGTPNTVTMTGSFDVKKCF